MKSTSPTSAKFILADDVRVESNSKLMVVGYYPNDLIIVLFDASVKRPANAVPGLRFVIACVCAGSIGLVEAKAAFFYPSGKKMFEEMAVEMKMTDDIGGTLLLQIPQVAVREYGTYRMTLNFPTSSFEYSFRIVKGPFPASPNDAPAEEKAKPRLKK